MSILSVPARSSTASDRLGLVLIFLAVTAANLAKPFHIDDAAHLEIARWIAENPFNPMSGTLNWAGIDEPIHRANQPHLYFYLLAGWGVLFGFAEIPLHLMQALFALAAILLFHRLATRIAPPHALALTALLALGPAFLVGQNLMVDVPLLALWLAFFLCLTDVDAASQTRRFLGAAAFCAAACLVKYSSLVLLVVLAAGIVLEGRWRQAWALLVPVGVLAAWSAFNIADYGSIHLFDRPADHDRVSRLYDVAMAWLATLGGVLPLGVLAAAVWLGRLRVPTLLVFGAAGAALLALAGLVLAGQVADIQSDVMLARAFKVNGGLAALAVAVALAGRAMEVARIRGVGDLSALLARREVLIDAYLLLWMVGTSAFYLLFSPFVATRHVLLVLPAILLLLGSRWRDATAGRAFAQAAAFAAVLSACLAVSDWRFAGFYRDQAAAVADSLPEGSRAFASGHWGFQWYAAQAGMPQVDVRGEALRPGDLLVVATGVDHQPIEREIETSLVAVRTSGPDPWSLFCTARTARFYASGELGPWSLSRHCSHRVEVLRIDRVGEPLRLPAPASEGVRPAG